nr:MAG TPA: toxin [Bacteriophage sp.]
MILLLPIIGSIIIALIFYVLQRNDEKRMFN